MAKKAPKKAIKPIKKKTAPKATSPVKKKAMKPKKVSLPKKSVKKSKISKKPAKKVVKKAAKKKKGKSKKITIDSPGVRLIADLLLVHGRTGTLMTDLANFTTSKKGPARDAEFVKFKAKYPELYGGGSAPVRNWNKLKPENTFAQIRRAYAQGLKEPTFSTQAQLLKDAYDGIPGIGHTPPPPPPTPKISLVDVYTRFGEATFKKYLHGNVKVKSKIVNVDLKATIDLKHICYLSMPEVMLLLPVHKQYRVLVEVKFKSGSYGWLSSPNLPIASNKDINDLFDRFQSYIVNQDPYLYSEVSEIIDKFTNVEIYWM